MADVQDLGGDENERHWPQELSSVTQGRKFERSEV